MRAHVLCHPPRWFDPFRYLDVPLCVTLQSHTCCFSSWSRRWKRCCCYYFCSDVFVFVQRVFFVFFSAFFELYFFFRMFICPLSISSRCRHCRFHRCHEHCHIIYVRCAKQKSYVCIICVWNTTSGHLPLLNCLIFWTWYTG